MDCPTINAVSNSAFMLFASIWQTLVVRAEQLHVRAQSQTATSDVRFSLAASSIGDRAASVASTEGRENGKKQKQKKRKKKSKTRPVAPDGKSRKSRHRRKGGGGAGKADAKEQAGEGGDDSWSPDPNDLDGVAWEKTLLAFFRKHNPDKVGDVPKMAKIYRKKRGWFWPVGWLAG